MQSLKAFYCMVQKFGQSIKQMKRTYWQRKWIIGGDGLSVARTTGLKRKTKIKIRYQLNVRKNIMQIIDEKGLRWF